MNYFNTTTSSRTRLFTLLAITATTFVYIAQATEKATRNVTNYHNNLVTVRAKEVLPVNIEYKIKQFCCGSCYVFSTTVPIGHTNLFKVHHPQKELDGTSKISFYNPNLRYPKKITISAHNGDTFKLSRSVEEKNIIIIRKNKSLYVPEEVARLDIE